MRSLFLLHNETINIWSHILGFAFFAGLFVHDLVLVIPAVTDDGKTTITKTDFLVLLVLLICYQVLYFGKSFNEVGVKNRKGEKAESIQNKYFNIFFTFHFNRQLWCYLLCTTPSSVMPQKRLPTHVFPWTFLVLLWVWWQLTFQESIMHFGASLIGETSTSWPLVGYLCLPHQFNLFLLDTFSSQVRYYPF